MNSSTNGKASVNNTTFSRETSVSIDIQAGAEIVWTLLTNVADFSRWNSTIISMEGEIKQGGKVMLKSTLDPKRTFKLKVSTFEPENKMIWMDGFAPFFQGVRTYTIQANNEGVTFAMHEKMGGLMFPLAAKHIPDFRASFEQYAQDLKKEAELIEKEA